MRSEPVLAALDVAAVQRAHSLSYSILSDYWTLTRPEISL
jgi:hypothetical protein